MSDVLVTSSPLLLPPPPATRQTQGKGQQETLTHQEEKSNTYLALLLCFLLSPPIPCTHIRTLFRGRICMRQMGRKAVAFLYTLVYMHLYIYIRILLCFFFLCRIVVLARPHRRTAVRPLSHTISWLSPLFSIKLLPFSSPTLWHSFLSAGALAKNIYSSSLYVIAREAIICSQVRYSVDLPLYMHLYAYVSLSASLSLLVP